MENEKKYISLDKVVEECKKSHLDDDTYTKGIDYWIEQMLILPPEFQNPITEDADFEIIEPKQLPNSKP